MLVELWLLLGVGCAPEDCEVEALVVLCDDYPGFVPYGVITDTRIGSLDLSLADLAAGGSYRETRSCELGCVPAGVVGAEVCSDASCGGDPTGTWAYTVSCGGPAGNPLGSSCPDGTTDDTWTSDGTLSLLPDGTFEQALTSQRLVHTLSLPDSCTTGVDSCSELEFGVSCSGSPADGGCVCVDVVELGDGTLTGSWEASGSTLTFHPSAGREWSAEYCVDSTGLTIDDGVTLDVLVRG